MTQQFPDDDARWRQQGTAEGAGEATGETPADGSPAASSWDAPTTPLDFGKPGAGHAGAGQPGDGQAVAGQPGYAQPGSGQAVAGQPGYAQPGYPQPGSGQPGYAGGYAPGNYTANGYQQSGYAPGGYPPQAAYGQPGYQQPMYAQPGYAVYPAPFVKPPRPPGSPLMGNLGVGMAVGAIVLSIVADLVFANYISGVVAQHSSSVDQYLGDAFTWFMTAQMVCSGLGIAALVTSIVAVSTNKGRPQGIVGIVLSVLGPTISYWVIAATILNMIAEASSNPTVGAWGA